MKSKWICFSFFALLFLFVFWGFITGQEVLFGSDPVLSNANRSFSEVVDLVHSGWKQVPLLGTPARPGLTFTRLLLAILQDGVLWNNLYYGLACVFASILFFYWLRSFKLSTAASLLASVVAFWLGTNLTLLYAAHSEKPYIVLLFVGSLIPIRKAVLGSWLHGLLWGGCLGLMFAQQPDVALFFALFSGAYFIFYLWNAVHFRPLIWFRTLVPAVLFALFVAAGSLLGGYEASVKDTVQTQSMSAQQKWDYMTQWSFPPEETIDLVAPGYTGWRSGEPEGPYWGRMGRSPGWEQTRQGFRNFKLESVYLGAIPILFALFALLSWRSRFHRSEIIFWSAASLLALLLSFGKFFPLYSMFYKLPVVNNIRNPNKFIQVFQVCFSVLVAHGFDAFWECSSMKKCSSPQSVLKPFAGVLIGILGVFVLCAAGLTLCGSKELNRVVALGWSRSFASAIVQNKIAALWHASVGIALLAMVVVLFGFPNLRQRVLNYKKWFAGALVLFVALDAVFLSKHYVKPMPHSYIDSNCLIEFIHQNAGDERVALMPENQIFGVLKTYTFPYNKIHVFNPGDLSRMPMDYKKLLNSMRHDPLGLWEFCSIKYLIAPTSFEKKMPASRVRNVFSCNVLPTAEGGFSLRENPAGELSVFELTQRIPRYALFAGSRNVSNAFMPSTRSSVSAVSLSENSTFPELRGAGRCGSVSVDMASSDRVRLRTHSDRDAILRCSDRYTSRWSATLDGVSVAVEPVDLICRGVFVPQGNHVVEIFYVVPRFFYYTQLIGYGLFLLLCFWSLCPKCGRVPSRFGARLS